MGTLHRQIWVSNGAGTSRRQRASRVYHWFLPSRLSDINAALDTDVLADVTRTACDLTKVATVGLPDAEGLIRFLLRSEAMGSSRIEGIAIDPTSLLKAELPASVPGILRHDNEAANILGNIHAMEQAIHLATNTSEITIEALKEIHRALCTGTDLQEWGRLMRSTQNWVGGNRTNPLTAEYVPPAPEEVEALLDDLCRYANRTDVSPVVQAALCHAQFETVHPFVDGNDRVGRALIHTVLLRRHAVTTIVPPISLALAAQLEYHYASLNVYQHALDPQTEHEAINDWMSSFSGAITDACTDVEIIFRNLQRMRTDWKERDSATHAPTLHSN